MIRVSTLPLWAMLFSLLALASCTSIDIPTLQNEDTTEVTVTFTDLEITHVSDVSSSMTRATVDNSKTQRIDLAIFDATGNIVKTITQRSTDTDFGTIKDTLALGTYKFVAIAMGNSNGAEFATSPTITSATEVSFDTCPPSFTFTASVDATLASNTPQNVAVTFGKRKTSTLGVVIKDATPTDVKKIQLVVSPSSTEVPPYLISPSTGLATKKWKYERTITLTDINSTTFTDKGLSLQLFLSEAEEQLDFTINALDESGKVLYSRTKEGVVFKQSTVTVATGTIFSSITSPSFSFDYLDGNDNKVIPISLD